MADQPDTGLRFSDRLWSPEDGGVAQGVGRQLLPHIYKCD